MTKIYCPDCVVESIRLEYGGNIYDYDDAIRFDITSDTLTKFFDTLRVSAGKLPVLTTMAFDGRIAPKACYCFSADVVKSTGECDPSILADYFDNDGDEQYDIALTDSQRLILRNRLNRECLHWFDKTLAEILKGD